MSYRVFKRAWWKIKYGQKVPHPTAKKTTLTHVDTEDEARKYCREWNDQHDPGPTSIKAEYESY